MKTALLVVDVQTYFLARAPKDLPTNIVHHIEASSYDFVAFTLFRNQDGSNWEKSLGWYKSKTNKEVKLPPELSTLASKSNTFEKHTYSALKHDQLLNTLRDRGIDEVHICGIDTDACVLATAYDAFDQGFRVKVLFELCFSRYNLDKLLQQIIRRNIQAKNSG